MWPTPAPPTPCQTLPTPTIEPVAQFGQTECLNPGSISLHHITSHHILLEGPLELHTSIALPHTLFDQHRLHGKELIGHDVVSNPVSMNNICCQCTMSCTIEIFLLFYHVLVVHVFVVHVCAKVKQHCDLFNISYPTCFDQSVIDITSLQEYREYTLIINVP